MESIKFFLNNITIFITRQIANVFSLYPYEYQITSSLFLLNNDDIINENEINELIQKIQKEIEFDKDYKHLQIRLVELNSKEEIENEEDNNNNNNNTNNNDGSIELIKFKVPIQL